MRVIIALERARLVWISLAAYLTACTWMSLSMHMDEFGSIFDSMHTELGSKFLSSLRIKIQLLKRLHRVSVAYV
jgi:uncharacterized PurR-regulated membrane protein YhhQ (DUF165 family)